MLFIKNESLVDLRYKTKDYNITGKRFNEMINKTTFMKQKKIVVSSSRTYLSSSLPALKWKHVGKQQGSDFFVC